VPNLSSANLLAQVGLACNPRRKRKYVGEGTSSISEPTTFAELAFAALSSVERDDVISWRHGSNASTHTFYNTATFVAKNTRERSFRVLATQCVGIGMAYTCRNNLDANFSFLWRSDFDFLNSFVILSINTQ